jgi:S-DNA-T family DNA segregation ATPase FtsK/SpoIIIE
LARKNAAPVATFDDEPALDSSDRTLETEPRRHEILGLVALCLTLLAALSIASYDARGGDDWVGVLGVWIASVLASAFGVAAWVVPFELGLLAVRLFGKHARPIGAGRLASVLVVVLVGCAMLHLSMPDQTVLGGHLPGGEIGAVIGEVLRALLGLVGAFVVCTTVLLLTVILRTSLSIVGTTQRLVDVTKSALSKIVAWARSLIDAFREAREIERKEREAEAERNKPRIVTSAGEIVAAPREVLVEPDRTPVDLAAPEVAPEAPPKRAAKKAEKVEKVESPPSVEVAREEEPKPEAPKPKPVRTKAPTIVAPQKSSEPVVVKMDAPPPPKKGEFVLPPTGLLDPPPPGELVIDAKLLRENAEKLVQKLESYGVKGRVDEIHPGPVVTMYEFEPAAGTKISRIQSLQNDLAMALAAQKVRIVAPIPEKERVGFELPNKHRQMVSLREILENPAWNESKAALPVAFGKDIAGKPVYGDLAKMPHLLVAGATGAGKSVGLNVMLTSLLMKRTPDDVRMLMIDPKVVELAVFDAIPHMLLPVVTDMKKASLALRWAVDEMERRYQMFADAGARNIVTYNERVEKVIAGELAPEKLTPKKAGKQIAQGIDGEDVLLNPSDDEAPDALPMPTKLPYIVVVVDEFADLMMVAAKDVESAIARLAQKARAAGIHVILATQRPSVDVITGMIKANFPARIAFKVSQRQDSQTIINQNGAEHLLGAGDMLMLPPGASDLKRVHSAYIGEHEVQVITDHLRAQGKPVYDERIVAPRDDEDGEGEDGLPKSDDPLYDKAVAAVVAAGYCSISHLQRQLGVGYNKAAKLVEQMEKEGVVGSASAKAGGRREVLVSAL